MCVCGYLQVYAGASNYYILGQKYKVEAAVSSHFIQAPFLGQIDEGFKYK